MIRSLAAIGAISALAAAASANVTVRINPLVMAGDTYGGGTISTAFSASENFAVNNTGAWLIESRTTAPLLIRGSGTTLPGAVYIIAGDPVAAPPGSAVGSFDSITLNNSGNSAFNLFYTPVGPADSGVHFNLTQLIPERTIATAAGLSAGTPYIGWFDALINDADQIIMVASIDDPAITSTVDRAIIRIDNPTAAATQTLLLKEGDTVVPGRLLTDVATGPHNTAFAGTRVLVIPDLDGATTDDSGVLMHDGTGWSFLAHEGDPAAPLEGIEIGRGLCTNRLTTNGA